MTDTLPDHPVVISLRNDIAEIRNRQDQFAEDLGDVRDDMNLLGNDLRVLTANVSTFVVQTSKAMENGTVQYQAVLLLAQNSEKQLREIDDLIAFWKNAKHTRDFFTAIKSVFQTFSFVMGAAGVLIAALHFAHLI